MAKVNWSLLSGYAVSHKCGAEFDLEVTDNGTPHFFNGLDILSIGDPCPVCSENLGHDSADYRVPGQEKIT